MFRLLSRDTFGLFAVITAVMMVINEVNMIVELLRPQLEVIKDIETFRQAKWPEPNLFGLWHGEKRSNEIQPVISWACTIIVILFVYQVHL